MLLARGADPSALDADGQSAAAHGAGHGSHALLALLGEARVAQAQAAGAAWAAGGEGVC